MRSFAAIPNDIARDPSIPSTCLRVLTVVVSHVGLTGHPLKQTTIATEMGVSLRTVKRATKWLAERQYLVTRARFGEEGGQLANLFCPGPRVTRVTPPVSLVSPQEEEPLQEEPQEEEAVDLSTYVAREEGDDDERETPRLVPEVQVEVRRLHPDPVHADLGLGPREVPPAPACSEARVDRLSTSTSTETLTGAPCAEGAESVGSPPVEQEQPHARHVPIHDSMTAIEHVLDRLERVQRNGKSTLASCPVSSHGKGNGDRNPSLSVTESDGKVLLNCMGGCHVQDVMVALGLDWDDLFEEPITNDRGVKVAEWTYLHRDGSPYMVAERWQTSTGKRFVQRVPGAQKPGLPAGFKPALYQLPKVLAAVKMGEPIWFVEGEKCVAAAEHLGLTATCGPGGVNNWHDYYADWLVGASLVNVVADNDDPGRAFAGLVAAMLKSKGIPVRTWAVAVPTDKADLYDHVLAGKGVSDLVPLRLTVVKPEGTSVAALIEAEYPPVTWAVPGLLPAGLAMLAGSPKVGKSLFALDIALGVASGQKCLDTVDTRQGSVLYLSLDNDTLPRLQRRFKTLASGRGFLRNLPVEFHTDWPVGPQAIQACIEWSEIERDEGRRPLLIVADTLAMIEPNYEGQSSRASSGGYSQAVHAMAPWARMTAEQDLCLLLVHHDRKASQADSGIWQDRILGSRGITASTHTMLYLDMEKDTPKGQLRVLGRDVGAQDLQIERAKAHWTCIDKVEVEERHLQAVPHHP